MKLNIGFLTEKSKTMITYKLKNLEGRFQINQSVEGERIETKIERVVTNNEPIKDGAPLIYTPRNEGVKEATNIRTDRFDVAITAMDKVAKSYTARRDDKPEMKASKGGDSDVGNESMSGGTDGKTASNDG